MTFIKFFMITLLSYLSPFLAANVVEIATPHDMRMEDFIIRRFELNKKESNYILRFSRSGEVVKTVKSSPANVRRDRSSRMLTDPATPHLVTGKWSLSSSGRITFSLKEDGFTERYSAEFQQNPFGDAPRMVKGSIVKDNLRFGIKNFFRRVTASFSANGTGEDTLDISYTSRPSL